MAQEIQIFNNDRFGQVRIQMDASDEPLFCASDVCSALGYSNNRDAIAKHVDLDDVAKCDIIDNLGRNQVSTFINESGLYSLIFGSKLESAKQFKKWVTSDVLPTIRKTGSYNLSLPSYQIADPIERAQKWIEEEQVRQQLQIENKNQKEQIDVQNEQISEMSEAIIEMKSKTEYLEIILKSKGTVTVTQIAQDYGMSAKKFNVLLRNKGIQHKVNGQWILYGKYIAKGYVHSKEIDITHKDGRKDVAYNTEWTQRGRLFLYDTLKKDGILPIIEQN